VHFRNNLTQNHPAEYPKSSARHSSRKSAFAKPRILISHLCQMYMWTIFGLASKAAHKSHHTEVLLCEMVCEVHIALLLLTLCLTPSSSSSTTTATQRIQNKWFDSFCLDYLRRCEVKSVLHLFSALL
jgi:hypothetical protein